MTIVSLRPVETLTGLAAARRELGISRTDAARLAGVSRPTVARLEKEIAWTPAAAKIALAYLALDVILGGFPDGISDGSESA